MILNEKEDFAMERVIMINKRLGMVWITMLFVMAAILIYGADVDAAGEKKFFVQTGAPSSELYYSGGYPSVTLDLRPEDSISVKLKQDVDYKIEYTGDYTANHTVTMSVVGIGNYAAYEPITYEINIIPYEFSTLHFAGGVSGTYGYLGSAIEPGIDTLTVNELNVYRQAVGEPLVSGTDYIIKEYKDNINAGVATVTIEGIGNYSGTLDINFIINPKVIDVSTITITPTSNEYNGEVQTPTISVPGYTEGVEYSVSYYCSPTFNAQKYEAVDELRQVGSYKIVISYIGDNYRFSTGTTTYTLDNYSIYSNEPYTCPHNDMRHFDAIGVTCEKAGYEEYYWCFDCKKYFKDEEGLIPIEDFENTIMTKALGHDWGDWTVTKEATADTDGAKERTCKRCGKVYTETIYRTGKGSGGSTSTGTDSTSGNGNSSGNTSASSDSEPGSNATNNNSEVEKTSVTDSDNDVKENELPTINIDNKKTYKKSKKIKINAENGIKTITINGKKVKVKKGKSSISFKLSKYKKYLKKKGKWNKLVVTDLNGNKTVISFKVK